MRPGAAPQRSLADWFRRLFAPTAAAPKPAAKAHAAAPGPVQAPAANSNAAPWLEYAPDFAPYGEALGLPYEQPAQPSEPELELIARLSAAVADYAARDDGGPKALPAASLRVLNLVARNDVEVTELAATVQQDPALTTAVLRVANSAALGPVSGQISTVRDAVIRLGVTESGRVAGAVAAKTLFSARSKSAHAVFASHFVRLHVAAASAGAGAAYLAMTRAVGRSDLAYLGGMLHDVGKSLALGALAHLALEGRAPRELPDVVLQRVLEDRHVELGAQAHDRWALPEYLTSLCASHHDASVPNHPSQAELHLVRAVSGLLALRAQPQPLERIGELMQSISVLGLTPRETRALDAELRRTMTRLHDVLS